MKHPCINFTGFSLKKGVFLFIPVFFLFTSCDKFEGEQTVPSYLQVDSIGFITDDDLQGSDKQKLADVWVYVDDDLIGGFEMPAIIPVLAEGIHKLEIRSGVLLNGISDTRAPNPCMQPIIFENFNFIKDSVTKAYGTSSYYSNAEFVWMENFEDASLAIKRSINSDTGIVRTEPAGNPNAFLDEFSQYSGASYLDNNRSYVQLVSDNGNGDGFVFDRGDFIFLELHYKNDIEIVVGLYITLQDNTVQERPFLVISPSEQWNKIYVNFTPIVNETVEAESYTVYLEAALPASDVSGYFLLDNIKLVTRPNL